MLMILASPSKRTIESVTRRFQRLSSWRLETRRHLASKLIAMKERAWSDCHRQVTFEYGADGSGYDWLRGHQSRRRSCDATFNNRLHLHAQQDGCHVGEPATRSRSSINMRSEICSDDRDGQRGSLVADILMRIGFRWRTDARLRRQGALKWTESEEHHRRTKHIEVRFRCATLWRMGVSSWNTSQQMTMWLTLWRKHSSGSDSRGFIRWWERLCAMN